ADIIWWNSNTGQVVIWLMDGASVTGGGSPGSGGLLWVIVLTSGFNGDGKTDLLWLKPNGQKAAWVLCGTSVIGGGSAAWPARGRGRQVGDPEHRRFQRRRQSRHSLAQQRKRPSGDLADERHERDRRWLTWHGHARLDHSILQCRLKRPRSKR